VIKTSSLSSSTESLASRQNVLHASPHPTHSAPPMVSTASRRGETLKESSKEKDVRISNIVAAKGTSRMKTCLSLQAPASPFFA